MIRGIDVAHYQGQIDWNQVAASGIQFAYLKATEGTTYKDPLFEANKAGCDAYRIPWGAYHFARPGSAAASEQARAFLAAVPSSPLPHVLDIEVTTLSPAATTQWALDWLHAVEAVTGRPPILYSYGSFITGKMTPDSALARFPLWLARYPVQGDPDPITLQPPASPRPWTSWLAWQYTSSGRVPGIPSRVDRNTAHESLLGAPPAPPTPDEEDMTTILWFKDAQGNGHAYAVSGVTGKHLDEHGLALLRYLKIKEANAFDPAWQGTLALVDGPLRNV